MQISELASRCGLTIDTLRYYEQIGLSPPITRTSSGIRTYTKENLDWFTLLASLRETGMPMRKMKHFASLYQQGDKTVLERQEILQTHAKYLEDQKCTLKKCSDLLEYKLTKYEEILRERP